MQLKFRKIHSDVNVCVAKAEKCEISDCRGVKSELPVR